MQGENLLPVLSAVYRDRICSLPVGRGGHTGRKNLIPCDAARINVFGRSQHRLRPLKLLSGQIGIYFEIIDVPVRNQVTPKCHLGRIECLMFVLQLEFGKTARGIPICNDAHDLGIAAFLLSKILDALTRRNSLRDSLRGWIDTISGDFFGLALAVHIIEVSVALLANASIHRQVIHLITAVENVHFAQGLFFGIRSQRSAGEHPQHGHQYQKQRDQSFFHYAFLLKVI